MNTKVKQKKMKDATTAYLTSSGHYFCRYEPYVWLESSQTYKECNTIVYYDKKTLERIQLATAKCNVCNGVMMSTKCGDFQACGCGASFVDTDRWFPERHRYGGDCTPITIEGVKL